MSLEEYKKTLHVVKDMLKNVYGSNRTRILKLALDIEASGTIPTDHICKYIIEHLRPEIERGTISASTIYNALPEKYKQKQYSDLGKRMRWFNYNERYPIQILQDQIIRHIKDIDDPTVLNMILEIVKKKLN